MDSVLSEPDDSDLLRRICDGNHHAFAQLVRRHGDRFYRLAYRFTTDRGVAEDIVQEAFLKIWENPSAWDARRNVRFTTWFHRVVINLSLDHMKKKKPLPLAASFDAADDALSADDALHEKQKAAALETALAELPPRQRVALNLCTYGGVSNREAAEIMQIDVKALESLLSRAKAGLRQRLQAWSAA